MGRNPVFKSSTTTHGAARIGNVGRVLVCVALVAMLIVSAMAGLQRSAFAAGFPNDGQGVSGDSKYYSNGTSNRLSMVTSDEKHEIVENFAFCLANGKKFPSISEDGQPNGIFEQKRGLTEESTYALMNDNHVYSVLPHSKEEYWDRFTKLTYIYLEDPTDIVGKVWNGDYGKARDPLYRLIQDEFWRLTDGLNVSPDANPYLFSKYSKEQQAAFYQVRSALDTVKVPFEKMEFRGYKPTFVSGLGYQALFTGRFKDDPVDITVTKEWKNVAPGVKTPDVYIQLYRGGTEIGTPQKMVDNKTKFKIQSKQSLAEYSVKEVKQDGSPWSAEGYTAGKVEKTTDTSFEVTNTKDAPTPGVVKVSKTWENVSGDATAARPEVYFQLLQNGKPVPNVEKQKWTGQDITFNIPDKDGLETYTVAEVDAKGQAWKNDKFDQPLIQQNAPGVFTVVNRQADGKKHEITVKKVDENNTLLAGAQLIVRRVFEDGSGEYVDGIKGAWQSSATEGEKVSLLPGRYQLEELRPPAGYKRATPIDFMVDGEGNLLIKDGETYKPQDDKTVTLANVKEEPKKYPVTFRKTEQNNATRLLAGAKFTVTSTTDHAKTYTWHTTDGESKLELEADTYTLTEVEAPDGYKKLRDSVEFAVTQDGKVVLNTFDQEGHATLPTVDTGKAALSVANEKVPFIGTTASLQRGTEQLGKNTSVVTGSKDLENLTVQDTVYYSGFEAGNYVAVATLIKESDEANIVGSAQQPFTVKNGEDAGRVTVPIQIEAKHITDGENGLTVLERVYKADDVKDGKVNDGVQPVASHVDAKDDMQTVVVDKVAKSYVYDFQKVDQDGKPLTGARLKVTYENGRDVPRMGWNTLTVPTPVTLEAGTYILTEVTVPQGYEKLADTKFTVKEDGTIDFNGSTAITVEKRDKQNTLVKVTNTKKPDPFVNPTGTLATTVTASGKAAAKDQPVTLTADQVKNNVTVTDTITYNGFVKGEQYKVTGTLNKITDNGTKAEAVTTKTDTFTADPATGNGEWTLNFGDVKLEEGTTYVVFETATSVNTNLYDSNNDGHPDSAHVVTHEDKGDKAQTVVVS
ncbi:thioester-forming surface-anchored protein, partial [Schaalia turicensis]|uniref:thioester-forming surface-anchored protein n=3 Tax=Bacteria TaxID=2 RepID=UPI00189A7B49